MERWNGIEKIGGNSGPLLSLPVYRKNGNRLQRRHLCKKKLRKATYTAAVCKFWGGPFFVFCLVPSVAQLSSASFYFLCFPAAAYVHLDTGCDPYCIVEVDNFWSGLFPSVAQLSSDFLYFSCFPVLQQILSLTWMVSTIFCLRGAHRPRPQ